MQGYLLEGVDLVVGDAPDLVDGAEAALADFVQGDEVDDGGGGGAGRDLLLEETRAHGFYYY